VEQNSYDFARLERAVTELADAHRRMRDENAALQRDVAEKNLRIRLLDEKILDANQRRSDVTKRVDELIAQIDQLESQLGSLEPE
jgi:chromosome segregation ATPase